MYIITESDRREYDDMDCRNISLEQFVTERRREEMNNAREMHLYMKRVKPGAKSINNIVSLKPIADGSVARTVVIDGANIMHCGSSDKDTREGAKQGGSIPDVTALLSVIRFFVVRDFDVFTVISRKYAKPDATNYKEAIDKLVENHLCVVVPPSNLDDSVALEFAAQINGVVVTSDQYRDHASESNKFKRIVQENRLGIKWDEEKVKKPFRNTRCTNKENDFLASKSFFFTDDSNSTIAANNVIMRLYAVPSQLQYDISKERLELTRPDKRKEKTMALLHKLITEAPDKCKEAVQRILTTPVHVEQVEQRPPSPESDSTQEVPYDDQSEYIAAVDYNEIDW